MQIQQLLDAVLVAISFWLAFELRNAETVIALLNLPPAPLPFKDYVWLYLVLLPATPLILEAQGFYARPMVPSRRTTLWMILKSCALMMLGLIIALFFTRLIAARSAVIWFGAVAFTLLMVKEEVVRMVVQSRWGHSQFRRRLLLIGSAEETARMRAELRAKAQEEIELAMEVDLESTSSEKLVEILHEHSINGVFLSAKHAYFQEVEAVIRACELEGIEVCLLVEFFRTQISRTTFDDFFGRPMLVFRSTPEASWQGVMKTLLDFAVALVLLIVGMPFFLLVALVIRITSPGPVLFRQQRSGLNGRAFTLYKFRTMVTNAEQLKHELAAMNEMSGPVFKVARDPRVTPIGRLLRKFSIDELPQLYNVLRGEMSLVGPRPLPVDEVRRFDDLAHRRRLSVKPGLTCLWQISGRNDVSDFRDWVRLDLEYIDNWSFWLDLKILCRTVPIVLTGAGAR
jgi:exopolysaccharide biosynthesis polyprenyl glycosylphosphotransferase